MSKKKRKRKNAAEDEVVAGINDDGEFVNDDGKFAAVDSEESDSDDVAADSMIKVTVCAHSSCFKSGMWQTNRAMYTVSQNNVPPST